MVIFDVTPIIQDANQLNEAILGKSHRELQQTLDSFVVHFDTFDKIDDSSEKTASNTFVGPDTLASNYVQLTGCHQRLEKSLQNTTSWDATVDAATRTNAAMDELQSAVMKMEKSGTERVQLLEREKALFMAEVEERRAQVAQEFRRKQDQLEELYANKTREVIYHNLVGNNHQWAQ
ncbi:hypothetical protein PHYBLDRAFT_149604 [Phycomyces blakesleeanus NRRL 1555(-)]|uniref:Biogenesis of lysosome-related organelles complex 1 subunit 5 n=1 Tax=Phycomyces blakesleeanus (strain ATCC 8743b / DSM 1359 / FGSC 10004 / NBRC 33097 / NRRL 1555) TaxID=763407 RepID=A0A163D6Y0_PHYB8|nr:hypothetical protein PHYBLDRAFT_149604 [Phycomyces blakesleeanus NRRL 1555(-)]OAD69200.1 hypothetical protein PHYBLDRAFT_149604 [Phycomyces blakesleeanus NRRL 1555(-)]|eukprot:XP_018287240.1 hypothetical protein PHYBLDRAFT_149604 [Phycomyces blakesleeanus NRRL 1555(-)]